MTVNVQVIDDDPSIRQFLTVMLGTHDCVVSDAEDGVTGLAAIARSQPEVVLLDVQMPGMNGEQVLRRIVEIDRSIMVIMISSVDEVDVVRRTLRTGAYDYLIKPIVPAELLETIARAVEHRRIRVENELYRKRLESLVHERTAALKAALDRVEKTYSQTILALGSALETRDVETQSHSIRVAGYTLLLCERLKISGPERIRAIERGAILHDIGKIGVPDSILRKPGALADEEWEVMKQHPVIGAQLLEGIEFLSESLGIVRSHHERWDGAGYPDSLAGEQIPIEARIFSAADTIDAITSDRPYRPQQPLSVARAAIDDGEGSQFDPEIVKAVRSVSDGALLQVRRNAGDIG